MCLCCEETHKLPGMYDQLPVASTTRALLGTPQPTFLPWYGGLFLLHTQTDRPDDSEQCVMCILCNSFSTLHDTYIHVPRLYSSECTLSLFLSWSLQQTRNIICHKPSVSEPLVSCVDCHTLPTGFVC